MSQQTESKIQNCNPPNYLIKKLVFLVLYAFVWKKKAVIKEGLIYFSNMKIQAQNN